MERRSQPIGFMIKQINNVFEKELNEKVKKLGLTSSQCTVLDYLFHTSKDEISQRDVERHLSLKNPTVTGLLKRLDEKGYILCVPNAKDKRKKNIYLTEKAYDIQRRMEAERRKLDRELTRGMSKREVASRVLFMADGKIQEQGTPQEIFTDPKNPRLRDFLARVL